MKGTSSGSWGQESERGPTTQSPIGHCKDFSFYSEVGSQGMVLSRRENELCTKSVLLLCREQAAEQGQGRSWGDRQEALQSGRQVMKAASARVAAEGQESRDRPVWVDVKGFADR